MSTLCSRNDFFDFKLLVIEVISSGVAGAKKNEFIVLVELDNVKGLGLGYSQH